MSRPVPARELGFRGPAADTALLPVGTAALSKDGGSWYFVADASYETPITPETSTYTIVKVGPTGDDILYSKNHNDFLGMIDADGVWVIPDIDMIHDQEGKTRFREQQKDSANITYRAEYYRALVNQVNGNMDRVLIDPGGVGECFYRCWLVYSCPEFYLRVDENGLLHQKEKKLFVHAKMLKKYFVHSMTTSGCVLLDTIQKAIDQRQPDLRARSLFDFDRMPGDGAPLEMFASDAMTQTGVDTLIRILETPYKFVDLTEMQIFMQFVLEPTLQYMYRDSGWLYASDLLGNKDKPLAWRKTRTDNEAAQLYDVSWNLQIPSAIHPPWASMYDGSFRDFYFVSSIFDVCVNHANADAPVLPVDTTSRERKSILIRDSVHNVFVQDEDLKEEEITEFVVVMQKMMTFVKNKKEFSMQNGEEVYHAWGSKPLAASGPVSPFVVLGDTGQRHWITMVDRERIPGSLLCGQHASISDTIGENIQQMLKGLINSGVARRWNIQMGGLTA